MGCGSDNSDDGPADEGSAGSAGSPGNTPPPFDPTTFCESECQLRVDANCPIESPQVRQVCEFLCQDRHDNHPDCERELTAVDQRLAAEVTYTCNGSGTTMATPLDACSTEYDACNECLGETDGCRF